MNFGWVCFRSELGFLNCDDICVYYVRAGGAIWLNPFATVLFSVCSAVAVACCVLYPCCMRVFGMFPVM